MLESNNNDDEDSVIIIDEDDLKPDIEKVNKTINEVLNLSRSYKLKNAEAHATYIVTDGDRKALKELKINLTCENEFLDEEI